ncbi:MAG TPA: M67 family metallopeptidase [Solirubrobacteraceae bacterium]|jgi:proteasome lid subunit RPN8/RPN11
MRIPRELYEQMIEHARAEAPNECVGLIASRDGDAVRLYRARNAAASPLRFEIDGAEQIRYHNDIEESGLELGAIYHSHTRTEPAPSQTDISFAAGWPGVLWVIVGLASPEPDVRTWRIDSGEVSEADLIVE